MADRRKLAAQQKAALLARERKQAELMTRSYAQMWQVIKNDLDALGMQIRKAQNAGETVNRGWLVQKHRLEGLAEQVAGEMNLTTSLLERTITAAQADAVLAGRIDAEDLIRAGLPPGMDWQPAFPTDAFRKLVGFSQDGQPLGDLLAELGPMASQDVKRALVTGIGLGHNPRKIAREVRTALGGNMARALTISRTEVLRSYREASRETYHANQDVVEAWVWHSAADARTCAVCFAMHGERFDTDESMDTHPSCRCALVPVTKPWSELGFDGMANIDAVAGRDEAVAAWQKGGKFTSEAIHVTTEDTAAKILSDGVDVTVGKGGAFGRGFYMSKGGEVAGAGDVPIRMAVRFDRPLIGTKAEVTAKLGEIHRRAGNASFAEGAIETDAAVIELKMVRKRYDGAVITDYGVGGDRTVIVAYSNESVRVLGTVPDLTETRAVVERGADLFAKLPPATQRRILGPGKYDLLQKGKIRLADLVEKTSSRRWGAGRRETTLKSLQEGK